MKRLLTFFLCIICFATVKAQSNYTEALQQGDDAFKKGQYKLAINKYFAAEAFDPSNKDEVKKKIQITFDKIEKLRDEAVAARRQMEMAQRSRMESDQQRERAEISRMMANENEKRAQMERAIIAKDLVALRNTNKVVAQKIYGLATDGDTSLLALLTEIQNLLMGNEGVTPEDSAVRNNANNSTYVITIDHLITIGGARTQLMDSLVYWINQICPKYGINTKQEYAHFIAQCCYHTDKFRTLIEYASGNVYEGRLDLGNKFPGDGIRYKGRGIFQTTGRANYLQLGIIRGQRNLFINDPELLAQPEYAIWSSCEYWKTRNLNDAANHADNDLLPKKINKGSTFEIKNLSPLEYISRTITGGLIGMEEKSKYYELAKKALGISH